MRLRRRARCHVADARLCLQVVAQRHGAMRYALLLHAMFHCCLLRQSADMRSAMSRARRYMLIAF